jgi:hypothetical protein
MKHLAILALAGLSPAPLAALQASGHETHGYMWMFLLMASMPYVLLAVIGGGIYRAKKREREQEVERVLAEQRAWEASRDG